MNFKIHVLQQQYLNPSSMSILQNVPYIWSLRHYMASLCFSWEWCHYVEGIPLLCRSQSVSYKNIQQMSPKLSTPMWTNWDCYCRLQDDTTNNSHHSPGLAKTFSSSCCWRWWTCWAYFLNSYAKTPIFPMVPDLQNIQHLWQ